MSERGMPDREILRRRQAAKIEVVAKIRSITHH